MALLWSESFQRIRTTANYSRGYFDFSGTWSSNTGRASGPALLGQVVAYPKSPVPSGSTFVCGTRQYFTSTTSRVILGCGFGLGNSSGAGPANTAISLCLNGSGGLELRRGGTSGTLLASSANGIISVGPLYHFAVKFVLHSSTGTAIVYLDGVEVTALTFTGNTSAVTSWDSFFCGNTSGGQCDLYVLDGTNPTGNDPVDPIPDVRVDYRAANGNGYSSGFTGSDGNSTDNYLLVDETNSDDDTTYVESGTAVIDAYAVEDAPLPGAVIVGVTAFGHVKKTDAGTASHKVGIRRGSTNYMGAAEAVPVTYIDKRKHYGVDPSTNGVWVESDFNALQVVQERP